MAFTSKLQRLACERNSLKWQLLGNVGNLGSMKIKKHLTPSEKEKLQSAIDNLEDVLHWWNYSNTEFGLKNPDTKITIKEN